MVENGHFFPFQITISCPKRRADGLLAKPLMEQLKKVGKEEIGVQITQGGGQSQPLLI